MRALPVAAFAFLAASLLAGCVSPPPGADATPVRAPVQGSQAGPLVLAVQIATTDTPSSPGGPGPSPSPGKIPLGETPFYWTAGIGHERVLPLYAEVQTSDGAGINVPAGLTALEVSVAWTCSSPACS